MFGLTTEEKISEELLTSYAAWDVYVSSLWASLLTHCQLPQLGTVVEVAPGASSKIALALKKMNFKGDVYLIEPYQKALDLVTDKYRELLPEARIYPLNTLLMESRKQLPKSIDCVLSHHSLDDMIMAMEGTPFIFEQLFSWVCQDKLQVHPNFESHWQHLVSQPKKLKRIEKEVIAQWVDFITEIKPTRWIMSQYPSLVLETKTMQGLNQSAMLVLQKIKTRFQAHLVNDTDIQELLNTHLNYNFDLIGNEVLNAKNWLIIRHY